MTLLNSLGVHEGVAKALSQLHQDVVERSSFLLVHFAVGEHGPDQFWVLGHDALGKLLLDHSHRDRKDDLGHWRQEFEYSGLGSAQEVWSDLVVQFGKRFFVKNFILLVKLCGILLIINELQQVEQLPFVVLKWCSGEEESEWDAHGAQSTI